MWCEFIMCFTYEIHATFQTSASIFRPSSYHRFASFSLDFCLQSGFFSLSCHSGFFSFLSFTRFSLWRLILAICFNMFTFDVEHGADLFIFSFVHQLELHVICYALGWRECVRRREKKKMKNCDFCKAIPKTLWCYFQASSIFFRFDVQSHQVKTNMPSGFDIIFHVESFSVCVCVWNFHKFF